MTDQAASLKIDTSVLYLALFFIIVLRYPVDGISRQHPARLSHPHPDGDPRDGTAQEERVV
jgi:hypothetical protein